MKEKVKELRRYYLDNVEEAADYMTGMGYHKEHPDWWNSFLDSIKNADRLLDELEK